MKRSILPAPLITFNFNAFSRFSLLKRTFIATSAIMAAMAVISPVPGATKTWTGNTSTDWATGTNWGTTAPASTDSLVFGAPGSAGALLTNTLTSSSFNVGGITFNSSATTAYTFTGNTFNLTAGIVNNGTALQTFNNTGGLTNSANSTFVVSSSGGISINSLTDTATTNQTTTVNGAGGTLTIGSFALNSGATTAAAVTDTITGTGNVTITGAITNGNAFANGLNYTGTGVLTLAGSNSYTGTTTLNSGNAGSLVTAGGAGAALMLNNAAALGGNGALVLTYGTIDNTSSGNLTLTSTNAISLTANGYVTFGGTHDLNLGAGVVSINSGAVLNLNGSSATLTFGSLVNAGGAGIIDTINGAGDTLAVGSFGLSGTGTSTSVVFLGNGNINFTGAITNGSTATASSFAYNGLGTVTMAGANTYAGGTTLSHGTINLTGALSSSSTGGAVTVNGGFLNESGTGTIGNSTTAVTLTISGGTSTTPGGQVVLSGNNTNTVNPSLGVNTSLTLDFSAAGAPTTNILSAASTITHNGGTLVIKGLSGATNSETVKYGLGALSTDSIVFAQNGATALNLTFSTIARNANTGTLDITLPTAGTVTFSGGSGAAVSASGILVNSLGNAYATANGGTTWLLNTSGVLTALSSYSTSYLTANNVDVGASDSVTTATAGSLRFNGSGRSLSISGTLTDSSNGILVTPGSSGTISGGTLTNNSKELIIINNGTLTIGSTIVGTGAVTIAGSGVTTLSGANSYTGSTNIDNLANLVVSNSGSTTSGTTNNALGGSAIQMGIGSSLSLRNDGAGGTSAGTVSYGNTFTFSGAVNIDVNNVTSGVTNKTLALGGDAGVSTQSQINITGGNGYSLSLGNIGATSTSSESVDFNPTTANVNIGSLTGNASGTSGVIDSYKLDGTSTGNTITGIISNGGAATTAINKINSGTWTLGGGVANTYTGGTSVGGGTLTLAAGTGTTLATTGALTLSGTGTFNYDNTGASGATAQSLGALSFTAGDGAVQISRVANQNSALTFASFSRSAGATANFILGSGGTNGTSNGFVLTGQTTGLINQGTFFGGSSYAYYDSGGFVRAINYGTDALSSTSAGGTTLSPVQSVSGVTTTASTTITIATTGLAVGQVVNGATIPQGATITAIGTGNITISSAATAGTGTLTFWNPNVQTTGAVTAQTAASYKTLNLAGTSTTAGNNDFTLASGATVTLQGILRSGNTLGSSATISGGTGIAIAPASDLVVRTDGVNDLLTINTVISGSNGNDNLVKSGAGTLVLGTSAVDTYYGNTYINQGILSITQDSNLGGLAPAIPVVYLNGGTLQAGASNVTLLANRNIALSANEGTQTIDTNGNTMTVNGVISGGLVSITNGVSTSTFNKIGAGTLVLNGTDTYVSTTLITAGTLQLGNGGTSGSLTASTAIVDNGTFAIDRSNTVSQGYDFLPLISGSGNVSQIGTGSTFFTAANTYTGGTTVTHGKLYVNNTSGSGTGSNSVTVNSGTTLAGNGKIAPTTGSGVTVSGTLSSGGVQTSGVNTIIGSGLTLDNSAALSKILTVNAGSTLSFNLGYTPGVAGNKNNFASPISSQSTFLNILGNTSAEITFAAGTDTINIVDLTAYTGSTTDLALRYYNNPYLLIQAGSNSDYSGLYTTGTGHTGNGYVLGVTDGTATLGYDPFTIQVTDVNGNITHTYDYGGLQLYLFNGDLEVVPEPSTWAMMLGGLALLVAIQRRKSKLN